MEDINFIDKLLDILTIITGALLVAVGGGFMWLLKKINASTTRKELEEVKHDLLAEQTKLKEYIFETMTYKINLLIEPIQINVEFIKESLNDIKQSLKNYRNNSPL